MEPGSMLLGINRIAYKILTPATTGVYGKRRNLEQRLVRNKMITLGKM